MKRLLYLDIMRGIAIWLVVIGHIIQYNNCVDWMHNPVFEWIYSFHMPLFFYISGYLAYKTTKIETFSDYMSYSKKKVFALLVPLVVWSLIGNRYFFAKNIDSFQMIDLWNVFYLRGLWFLKYLFVISLLYGIFHWIESKWNIDQKLFKDFAVSSLIFAILFGSSFWIFSSMLRSMALFFFFFMIGAIVSKHKCIETMWKSSTVYAISFVIFCILSTHWNSDGNMVDDLIKVMVAPCAFVVFDSLCRNIEKWGGRIFVILGRYSLVIYCSHWALLNIVSSQVWDVTNLNSFWLFAICGLLALPICGGCILFAKLIEHNNVLSFFLMGKKYRNGKY